jgi:hypothetical protein
MKSNTIIICFRIIGTLSGIIGLFTLVFTPFMFFHAKEGGNALVFAMLLFPLLIGLYEIYFCYLMWRKLSPVAIKHFFGMIGFFIIVFAMKFIDMKPKETISWMPFAYIGLLIVIYYGYRALSNRVSKALFPETTHK